MDASPARTFLKQILVATCLVLASAAASFAQTQKMTFDELPSGTPLNGTSLYGVSFTFTVGGVPSAGATFLGGPGVTQFVQDPSAEGPDNGVLTVVFTNSTSVLSFGLARSTFSALSPGAIVQLYDGAGSLLQTTNLDLSPLVSFSEAQFNYSGSFVKTMVLSFPNPGEGRFAFDNLVYQSGPLAGAGAPYPASAEISDQKAGSVLFFNYFTSTPSAPNNSNTRFSITNTNENDGVFVHLFFVEGSSCGISDRFVCLSPSQTVSFFASEQDPGTTGYMVAVAVDARGCPINFNFLIGDEDTKLQGGEWGSFGAEAFSAIAVQPVLCDGSSQTATLNFDGNRYNLVPRVLALSNIASAGDGVTTRIIINRIGGDLSTSAGVMGTVFGALFDDQEVSHSFTMQSLGCQRSAILNDDFPRTSPRFTQAIPAGQSGWMKLFAESGVGIMGAALANVGSGQEVRGFNGSHNLHKLRLTTETLTIPVFPPAC
jgi:hypothetical protein